METNFIWKNLEWILLSFDDDNFILRIDWKYYKYSLWADCCSETYISDIIKNISLKEYPSFWYKWESLKIVWYEELDLEEWEYIPRKSRQDVDSIYWIKIYLECEWDSPNAITIVYRNSSNWYYGWFHNISEYSWELEYWELKWYKTIQYDFHNPF